MVMVDVFSLQNEKTAEMELKDEVFNVPVKVHVLHQVVVSQLNNRRSGTASTKTRSEVRGSKRKLWRQKGTGRARVGSAWSPTRRGGGVAFGPRPRIFQQRVPKKVRKASLRMALTDKVQADQLFVVDHFDLPEPKTKEFIQVMRNFEVKKALIVTEGKNVNLERSSQNVPWVKVMRCEGLNTYDVLRYDSLFLSQTAARKVEEALAS